MDEESQILLGRPFGGIAILWKKCFNAYCSIKRYDCDRIVGIKFVYGSFTALFLRVYYLMIAQKILMITCFISVDYCKS